MRIHCGNYAYEVVPVRDPRTQVLTHWEFDVFQIMPCEKLMTIGTNSPSKEHAKRNAEQIITCFIELDKDDPRQEQSRRAA